MARGLGVTPVKVGQALRSLRESRELRMDQVKGFHKSVVSRLENAQRNTKMETLLRYLKALGYNFSDLQRAIDRLS